MPFFAPLLISAALAIFTAAASISLPGSLPASVSSGSEPGVPAFSQINDIPAVGGQLSSLEGKVENAAAVDLDARDVKSDVDSAIESIESKINARSTNTPSVAVIFSDLQTQIRPYTEELITSSNISASLVKNSVSSINASVVTAISRLQALSGQNPSTILAPVEGDGQLTVPQVASIASDNINMIVGAAANVVRAAAGADIDPDDRPRWPRLHYFQDSLISLIPSDSSRTLMLPSSCRIPS
ncbi:hypothetical protein JVU11DRAFT_8293 [Chiua virens]|nr:hypothetical protein JVU11DRAFT_8293 [Chiua virens]